MPNGQILNGRIDLLLETEQGYVLIDHKSSPLGEQQWDEIVGSYQGQLAAYASAIEAATGSKVLEQWLWLPVAGGMVQTGRIQV
jgi:ATP-dependent exoDNAse (exonuclease V) beta subunit